MAWLTKRAAEDKELYRTEWLSLRETPDNYIYVHENRSDGQGVAILVYDRDLGKILGRFERNPAHADGFELCAITGGVEKDDPLATAVMELKEEAGIDANPDELLELGTVRPSKSSDMVMHLYALDAQGKELGEILGDGSKGEEGAYVEWMTSEEIAQAKDPILHAMALRLMAAQS